MSGVCMKAGVNPAVTTYPVSLRGDWTEVIINQRVQVSINLIKPFPPLVFVALQTALSATDRLNAGGFRQINPSANRQPSHANRLSR